MVEEETHTQAMEHTWRRYVCRMMRWPSSASILLSNNTTPMTIRERAHGAYGWPEFELFVALVGWLVVVVWLDVAQNSEKETKHKFAYRGKNEYANPEARRGINSHWFGNTKFYIAHPKKNHTWTHKHTEISIYLWVFIHCNCWRGFLSLLSPVFMFDFGNLQNTDTAQTFFNLFRLCINVCTYKYYIQTFSS